MNWLVTAGNTQTPIDRMRCFTNIRAGRAGVAVARTAWGRSHTVTLVTSQPELLLEYGVNHRDPGERFSVITYRTFDELLLVLQTQIRSGQHDALCHAAAVSDFLPAGAFTPNPGTMFNARTGQWESRSGPPALTEQKAARLDNTEPELWVRLVRAPQVIDRFRKSWGFAGILVEFRVEVGIGETELIERAELGRERSGADLVAATTLDGAAHWAYLGPRTDRYERVARRELPDRLVLTVEDLYQERAGHG